MLHVHQHVHVQQQVDPLTLKLCCGELPPVDETVKDDDVLAEEVACLSEERKGDTILVQGLKKRYSGGKYAVKGVSMGIPNGECFGLLGINGAGKSSTLAMLSGEFAPSGGNVYLNGLDLTTNVHTCRRKLGYCPQFDSIFELLTAREHLQLYARIKGIKEEHITTVAQNKIDEMGLAEYADRYAGTYSGGNKRKLSVAIAMIGEPALVFLDEPSTGMDPVAKRFMWDVITEIVTKREKCSLILTTHSMEECEALCTRIGIMVGGVMRCLGSAQKLRTKYGSGYQLEIGMNIPSSETIAAMANEIATILGVSAASAAEKDFGLTRDQVTIIFASKLAAANGGWKNVLTNKDGSGADLQVALDAHGDVSIKHLASWIILETQNDQIIAFLKSSFPDFVMRERQPSKLRIEISDTNVDNSPRMLSSIFGAIESNKTSLSIHEYSISQTSLEQIFNFFASQQEEEQGSAGALTTGVAHADDSSVAAPVNVVAEVEMTNTML